MRTPRIMARRITAADLIRRILKEIKAEPARLNMKTWVLTFKGTKTSESAFDEYIRGHARKPSCGTVACFAGWGMVLLRQPHETGGRMHCDARQVMENLVGVVHENGEVWTETENLFSSWGIYSRPGTRAHAKEVTNRAEAYLKRHPELETRVIDVATRKIVN